MAFSNVLNAVGARSGADAWAVGNYLGPNDDDGQVMPAEHWNGSAWSQVPTPNVVFFDEKLDAVSAAAANDVWAAGPAGGTTSILHFDGTLWAPETTPAGPDGQPVMAGIAAVPGSPTEVWAAGVTLPAGGGYHTFVVHHP